MITPTTATPVVTDLDIVRTALSAEYDEIREVGRGGMAIVYRGREKALDREVAIKVLPFTLAFDQSVVERFLREARTSAALEHPHIIPIHGVGQAGQVTYFTMKLLRGQSLSDRLLEKGPLSPAETRRVLVETASALAYAHQHGVVHRDIKPDNILFDEGGRCVVTDFGIARSGGQAKLTATGTSVGTPRYMSPEQARARAVDGRSDIYSLGVVGYECLAGRPPFDGDDVMAVLMAHVSQPLPMPKLDSVEAEELYQVIERMLAKAPEERFKTAEDVIDALSTNADATLHASRGTAGPAMQRVSVRVAARRLAAACASRLRLIGSALQRTVTWLHTSAATRPLRFWAAVGGSLIAFVGIPAGTHYGVYHRSRCPALAAGTSTTDPATSSRAQSAASSFSVLVDDIGSVSSNADVYYDVCGLTKGARFTTQITITKTESGLRRFLGSSVPPIRASFEEIAGSPAVRRHRTLDMDDMPAGAYSVAVSVTDDKGRRRDKTATLRLRE